MAVVTLGKSKDFPAFFSARSGFMVIKIYQIILVWIFVLTNADFSSLINYVKCFVLVLA